MLVERAGDGTLATFMRPSRAIECAHALHGAVKTLNLDLRAGIHTAEVELRSDGRIGGINVHLCARVMAQAEAGEVMVSHVVQGMLLGSHYQFEDRGCHELKGIAGECHLYSSVSGEVLAP
jgi:class 3 adenylate cyclase